jgi:hypothetical protein
VVDFTVNGEHVTAWPPTVLMRHFREELERRGKDDFEPGERIQIRPKGKHPEKGYWLFADTVFEHAVPRPSTLDMFNTFGATPDDEELVDDHGTPITY